MRKEAEHSINKVVKKEAKPLFYKVMRREAETSILQSCEERGEILRYKVVNERGGTFFTRI